MTEFEKILISAKEGSESAKLHILDMYKPLILKYSMSDYDLFQILAQNLMDCINKFKVWFRKEKYSKASGQGIF